MLGQEDDGTLLKWVLGAVGATVVTLLGAVKFLFGRNESTTQKNESIIQEAHTREIEYLKRGYDTLRIKHEETKKQSDECMKDREELRVEIAKINERLSLYIERHGDRDEK